MSNRKWESDMANEKFEERHIICEVRSKSLDRAKVKGLLLELVGPALQAFGAYRLCQSAAPAAANGMAASTGLRSAAMPAALRISINESIIASLRSTDTTPGIIHNRSGNAFDVAAATARIGLLGQQARAEPVPPPGSPRSDLGRCFVIRAIVEALTVPWTALGP